jgi:hypothetical protein
MKRKIGYRLLEALTHDELAKVFDAAFSIINPDHLEVLLSRLDGGTAGTLAGLVTSSRNKFKKNHFSESKNHSTMATSLGHLEQYCRENR